MSGHTPPPWCAEQNGNRPRIMGPIEEGPFDENDCGLPGPRRRIIAECNGLGNEYVIAAAPELLAELERLVDTWGGIIEDRGSSTECDAAREVIAKARGNI